MKGVVLEAPQSPACSSKALLVKVKPPIRLPVASWPWQSDKAAPAVAVLPPFIVTPPPSTHAKVAMKLHDMG